jgi:hypothetical protein
MLLVFAGAGPLGAAIGAARDAGGAGALLRGIALGVGLALLSVALLRIISERVFRCLPARRSDRETNQKVRLMYFAAFAWLWIASFLSWYVTSNMLRR